MQHIYHKGKYRSGEWCKHLRPFLKQVGNKRWRKDGAIEIEDTLRGDEYERSNMQIRNPKRKKLIKVKYTLESAGGFKYSYTKTYKTMKQATDALNRNAIIRATVFEKKGKIIGRYEKKHTKQTNRNRERVQHKNALCM